MNGGPGASSLIGAFTEMGQLIFNRNSNSSAATPKLFRNPYSCASSASALLPPSSDLHSRLCIFRDYCREHALLGSACWRRVLVLC